MLTKDHCSHKSNNVPLKFILDTEDDDNCLMQRHRVKWHFTVSCKVVKIITPHLDKIISDKHCDDADTFMK